MTVMLSYRLLKWNVPTAREILAFGGEYETPNNYCYHMYNVSCSFSITATTNLSEYYFENHNNRFTKVNTLEEKFIKCNTRFTLEYLLCTFKNIWK